MYEYKCQKCGHVFELIQRFSDAPLTVHEGCGGELEKLVSAPAFHLKGSGWYATDYAKGSDTNPAPKPGDSAAKTDGKESKSESKDSKTDSTPAPAASTTTKESSSKDSASK